MLKTVCSYLSSMKLYLVLFATAFILACGTDSKTSFLEPLYLQQDVDSTVSEFGFYKEYGLRLDSSHYEFIEKKGAERTEFNFDIFEC